MAIKDLVPWRKSVPVRRETVDDSPLLSLHQEVDQLFEHFFGGSPFEPFARLSTLAGFSPRVNVSENDVEMTVSAELPGVDEKDIDVAINERVLTISGERHEEKEDTDRDWYRREQSYGSFRRSIALPAEVDVDHVSAAFKHGVLTVSLPKAESSRRKRIAVQAA